MLKIQSTKIFLDKYCSGKMQNIFENVSSQFQRENRGSTAMQRETFKHGVVERKIIDDKYELSYSVCRHSNRPPNKNANYKILRIFISYRE